METQRYFFKVSIEYLCPVCKQTHVKITGAEIPIDDRKHMERIAMNMRLNCMKDGIPMPQNFRRYPRVVRITENEFLALRLPLQEQAYFAIPTP